MGSCKKIKIKLNLFFKKVEAGDSHNLNEAKPSSKSMNNSVPRCVGFTLDLLGSVCLLLLCPSRAGTASLVSSC